MKTILTLFKSVTDEIIREKLLHNLEEDKRYLLVESVSEGLMIGFIWENTTEGDEYWDGVHTKLYTNEIKVNNII